VPSLQIIDVNQLGIEVNIPPRERSSSEHSRTNALLSDFMAKFVHDVWDHIPFYSDRDIIKYPSEEVSKYDKISQQAQLSVIIGSLAESSFYKSKVLGKTDNIYIMKNAKYNNNPQKEAALLLFINPKDKKSASAKYTEFLKSYLHYSSTDLSIPTSPNQSVRFIYDNESLKVLDFTPFIDSLIARYQEQGIPTNKQSLISVFDLWRNKVLTNPQKDHFSQLSIGSEMIAILFWEILPSPGEIYIAQLIVHYEWQRIGIGKLMMRKVYEMNPKASIFKGLVRKKNIMAREFYKNLGAVECDFRYEDYNPEDYQGFQLMKGP
jgi:ribosomal protein S18 acetylase RimI-like enzyme